MLHPVVRTALLEQEVSVARERHGARLDELTVDGQFVVCRFGPYRLRLDGASYDAEPFRVAFIDAAGNAVPAREWPPNLLGGDNHPVLGAPWCCVQGTLDYHAHPSHVTDLWDKYRGQLRLASLLDHLLRRSGR